MSSLNKILKYIVLEIPIKLGTDLQANRLNNMKVLTFATSRTFSQIA